MDLGDLPHLLTVQQAATFLRLTAGQVRAAISDGELTVVQLGDAILVDTGALLADLGVDVHRCGGDSAHEVLR
jgi:excisionase family DNA binding protein